MRIEIIINIVILGLVPAFALLGKIFLEKYEKSDDDNILLGLGGTYTALGVTVLIFDIVWSFYINIWYGIALVCLLLISPLIVLTIKKLKED